MSDQIRLFEAGPDPFGRMWKVQFRWLQTGISIRHADTVDVKFFISCEGGPAEEKVIAIPHNAFLRLAAEQGRKVSDPMCMRMAGLHVRRMIETFQDIDKTLVTLTPEQVFEYDQEMHRVTVPQRR